MDRIIMNEVHKFEMNCRKVIQLSYFHKNQRSTKEPGKPYVVNLYETDAAMERVFGMLHCEIVAQHRYFSSLTSESNHFLEHMKNPSLALSIKAALSLRAELMERPRVLAPPYTYYNFATAINRVSHALENILLISVNDSSDEDSEGQKKYNSTAVALAIYYLEPPLIKWEDFCDKYSIVEFVSVERRHTELLERVNRIQAKRKKQLKPFWIDAGEILKKEGASSKVMEKYVDEYQKFLIEKRSS